MFLQWWGGPLECTGNNKDLHDRHVSQICMQMGLETLHPKYYYGKIGWPEELIGKPFKPVAAPARDRQITYIGKCPTKADIRCKVNRQKVLMNPQSINVPEPWLAADLAQRK